MQPDDAQKNGGSEKGLTTASSCRKRPKPAGRKAARRQVIELVSQLFPPQWFARWPVPASVTWTPQKVVWVSLIMYWIPGTGICDRFQRARQIVSRLHPRWTIPVSLGGFIEAQERVWPQIQAELIGRLRPDASWTDQWKICGWLLIAVDGSKFECPRTQKNEEKLSGEALKTPQIFQTTVLHIGTGLPWDFEVGPGLESERRQFDRLLQSLPDEAMVVADAGFISFALCQSLMRSNRSFVFRVAANMRLVEGLSSNCPNMEYTAGCDLTCLWPKEDSDQQPVLLRRVTVLNAVGQPVVLVTNVLETNKLSDADLLQIYRHRWEIELHYRTFKQTWNFATLRSRKPETALQEQRWRFVSHWALRHLAVRSRVAFGENPRNISQAGLRRLIQSLLEDADADRTAPAFETELRRKKHDTYTRTTSKCRRKWPRKSSHKEPKPPKLRQATTAEVQLALQPGFLYTTPG